MDNSEKKIKHLEMIQSVITRMASNSFALKGWAVTLVVGLFAIASKDAPKIYFAIAFIPIIVFWFLDSYYLKTERLYRHLFNKMRCTEEKYIDFDMNAKIVDKNEIKENKLSFLRCLFSVSEWLFYVPLGVVTVTLMFLDVGAFLTSIGG